jgi:hypothetical protein
MLVPKVTRPAPAPATEAPDYETENEATGAPVLEDPLVVKLTQPLRTHKGMIHELRLREPRASDFIEIGRVPFDVRGEGADRRATVDFKCAAQWAARLTDVDEILLGSMRDKDWLVLVARINVLLLGAGSSAGN